MAKPLKKHVQQTFEFRTHGGKRKNAGRKPKGKRSSEPHKERDDIDPRHPLLITSRIVEGLGSMRRKDTFRALRTATLTVFALPGFHVVYASLQANHLHLIVEAANKDRLAHGMKVLLGSAAKHINRALGKRTGKRRKGTVFSDRYHASALSSPRQVRNAVAYVLNNWRRHGEDCKPFAQDWKVDPFSNAVDFFWWKERVDVPTLYKTPATYLALATWLPKTWLLRVGWLRHELVSLYEVPGRP